MLYLGFSDLVYRWVYTRQGVHQLLRSPDFPAPTFIINRGRTKIWRLDDIEAYEQKHPEVTDDDLKRDKVRGYARAVMKGGVT